MVLRFGFLIMNLWHLRRLFLSRLRSNNLVLANNGSVFAKHDFSACEIDFVFADFADVHLANVWVATVRAGALLGNGVVVLRLQDLGV